jgi:hypothetical protein
MEGRRRAIDPKRFASSSLLLIAVVTLSACSSGSTANPDGATGGAETAPPEAAPPVDMAATAADSGGAGTCVGVGAGTGLRARYYGNRSLEGAPVFTRVEPTVDAYWRHDSPVPGMLPSNDFSVRWTGKIQPRCSETYRFFLFSDDGARVWIDGALVCDFWYDQRGPEHLCATKVPFGAGQTYDIVVEYFEAVGMADVHLSWESPSTPREVLPPSQLYLPDATPGP